MSMFHRLLYDDRCCCCRVRTGATLAGVFTLLTSSIQLAVQVALYQYYDAWTTLGFTPEVEEGGDRAAVVFESIPRAYIALGVGDILMILISVAMLVANSKNFPFCLQAWIVYTGAYVIYEAITNIIFFYMSFSIIANNGMTCSGPHCLWELYYTTTTAIFFVYWLMKLVCYGSGLYAVVKRTAEIKDSIMMANLSSSLGEDMHAINYV